MTLPRAAMTVAVILTLVSILMLFHLYTIWVGVQVCSDYARGTVEEKRVSGECQLLDQQLNAAVDKYLSVFLSLLGGAAVSGGYAVRTTKREEKHDDHVS